MKIHIKNAIVFDPFNEINGEQMDIFVEGGKITEKFSSERDVIEIDCRGKVLMPAGIDIHTHVAGGPVNEGRLFRPEDKKIVWKYNKGIRSGSGFSVPSTFLTGYEYALLGYKFLVQPIVPPLKAKHTHQELMDIPLMDKVSLLLLGNNYLVAKYIENNEYELLKDYVAWMLNTTKTYGIKAVNPGGFLAWLWGEKRLKPGEKIQKFNITPADIIQNLGGVSADLEIATPLHLHLNGIGFPGNYEFPLETIKLIEFRTHIVHLQFSCYGGDSWRSMSSESDRVLKEVERNERVTFDVGQVTLDNTTTMTADAPFEHHLYNLTGNKWSSRDVELECGSGIVPYTYSRKSLTNSIQWAIGLELVLLSKDLGRVCLSTDHPNAGPFIRYPRVIAWLMDREYRGKFSDKLNKTFSKRCILPSIDRELSLYEISLITRKSPADIIGLGNGGISSGSNADIVVYDVNPEVSKGEVIERAFSRALYTIINGEIVVREGEVINSVQGRTLYSKTELENPNFEKEIEYFFRQRYSVGISNYSVDYDGIVNVRNENHPTET